MQTVTPFLMFNGRAEEAISFYQSVFDQFEIEAIQKYGPGAPLPEGSVMHAIVRLKGQDMMCNDHGPANYTPAMSLFINFDSAAETEKVFEAFAAEGRVYMPLAAHSFSPKFGWVADKFGVSWQLRLIR